MNIRLFFVICLFVFSVSAPPAHAGMLEFFFPMLRDARNDPSNNLQAPFADLKAQEEAGGEQSRTDKAVPLDQPHRSSKDISRWIVTAASEALVFSGEDHQQELANTKQYFDDAGRAQYKAFLSDKKIMNVLESKGFQVRSYVSDPPLLLNEGAVQGRYRWLYEVPLVVSYLKRGLTDYTGVEPVNQHMTLQLQIGRSETAADEPWVFIESWSGKVKTAGKKSK